MNQMFSKLSLPQITVYKYLLKYPGLRSIDVAQEIYPNRSLKQSEPCVSRIMTSLETKGFIDSENRPKYNSNGIELCDMHQKLCLLKKYIERGSKEDALRSIFDIINHLAPGYEFKKHKLNGIKEIQERFGDCPSPILEEPFGTIPIPF